MTALQPTERPPAPPARSRPPRRGHFYRGLSLLCALTIALESLARNTTRTFLATLGIIIGVGCVITMMGLGEGTKAQMEDQIRQMGSNTLSVRPSEQRTGAVSLGSGSGQSLSLDDADAIGESCPAVLRASPRVNSRARAKFFNRNTNTDVSGVTADYFPIRNFQIAAGRAFLRSEIERRDRVCLLGPTVLEELFGARDPIGERIYVRGQPFLVIGVLAPRDEGWDNRVWAPVTTVMDRILGQDYLERIEVQAVDEESMDPAQEQMEALLRRRHRLGDDAPNDFEIRNQADLLETVAETSQVLSMLLAGVASVSLLVGGIGIMNIMLVSVTERTREIGIRRAIGARRGDVLLQFVIEALVMCGVGAALGIGLGFGACWLGAVYAGWPVQVTPFSLLISSGFAVGIGLFFGFYPALRAARLSVLAALRYQ
jgi:ABC-type antimicrobial peptide transport system permease subunit